MGIPDKNISRHRTRQHWQARRFLEEDVGDYHGHWACQSTFGMSLFRIFVFAIPLPLACFAVRLSVFRLCMPRPSFARLAHAEPLPRPPACTGQPHAVVDPRRARRLRPPRHRKAEEVRRHDLAGGDGEVLGPLFAEPEGRWRWYGDDLTCSLPICLPVHSWCLVLSFFLLFCLFDE